MINIAIVIGVKKLTTFELVSDIFSVLVVIGYFVFMVYTHRFLNTIEFAGGILASFWVIYSILEGIIFGAFFGHVAQGLVFIAYIRRTSKSPTS